MGRRVSARVRRRRTLAVVIAIVVVAAVVLAVVWMLSPRRAEAPRPTVSASSHPASSASASPSPTPSPTFDRQAHSIDDPTSIWVVVNKSRQLNPKDYVPADIVYPDVPYVNRQGIRQVAAQPLVDMFAAAKSAGSDLAVQSGYRPYDMQVRIYDSSVATRGKAVTDADTARPGYSEHQTGLTVDISAPAQGCTLDQCFGKTKAGLWLAENAWRYGFLLRYPADKEQVTGYSYEPWHFRYIGVELATEMHRTGVTTLEEFFGVPGGTEYR